MEFVVVVLSLVVVFNVTDLLVPEAVDFVEEAKVVCAVCAVVVAVADGVVAIVVCAFAERRVIAVVVVVDGAVSGT